jgi:hypothetical protein
MADDLLEGIESNQLGEDERSYRREQAVFWLTRAAERGSRVSSLHRDILALLASLASLSKLILVDVDSGAATIAKSVHS